VISIVVVVVLLLFTTSTGPVVDQQPMTRPNAQRFSHVNQLLHHTYTHTHTHTHTLNHR